MSIIVDTIIHKDTQDRNLWRVGRTAFVIRRVQHEMGETFDVEDTRKWKPFVASAYDLKAATRIVERLLAAERS